MTPAAAEIRSTGIGSSEIAGVLGMSPWADPFAIYASKVGELQSAPPSPRMKWGTLLQKAIAQGFTEETGLPHVWKDSPVRHPERSWQIASPDALIPARAEKWPWQILEVKAIALDQAKHWGDSGSGDIPDWYALQVQWQMSTMDLEHCWIAALIAGNDFRTYRVNRDRDIEAVLLEEGERFWFKHVLAKNPPPIGSSRAAAEYLRQRFPRNTEALRKPTDEELPLLYEYAEVRASFDLLEDKKIVLENRIKLSIGEADGFDGWCTWRKSKDSTGVNYETVALTYLLTLPPEERAEVEKKFTEVLKVGPRKFLWRPK